MQVRNLFFTRTALGVYATILGAIAIAGTTLANKYDQGGQLKTTDWVLAGCGVLTAVSGQAVVLVSKVGSNGAFTYTPRGVWGPDKEEVEVQAEKLAYDSVRQKKVIESMAPPKTSGVQQVVDETPPAQWGRLSEFNDYRGD